MAVDGYYVVVGVARHEYKQGWKLLTLWDGYGLSEATWEPMSAFIQPDGSIQPIFRPTSLLTQRVSFYRALRPCPCVTRKTTLPAPIYLLLLNKLSRLPALGGPGTSQTSPLPVESLLRATPAGV